MQVTAEDYKAARMGEKTLTQISDEKKAAKLQEYVTAMSTRDFLIGRTQETIKVPITSAGGVKDIEIRARLSRDELRRHTEFLNNFKRAASGDAEAAAFLDSEPGDLVTASFLSQITVEPELDTMFWMSGGIDPSTVQEILLAYFTEPARRMAAIEKFRSERLRAELQSDA